MVPDPPYEDDMDLRYKIHDQVQEISIGVDGISDERYKSGNFYASKEGKMTGEVVDQGTFFVDLRNTSFQDNADRAIHRFIKSA
jgi:hypothetical protein